MLITVVIVTSKICAYRFSFTQRIDTPVVFQDYLKLTSFLKDENNKTLVISNSEHGHHPRSALMFLRYPANLLYSNSISEDFYKQKRYSMEYYTRESVKYIVYTDDSTEIGDCVTMDISLENTTLYEVSPTTKIKVNFKKTEYVILIQTIHG